MKNIFKSGITFLALLFLLSSADCQPTKEQMSLKVSLREMVVEKFEKPITWGYGQKTQAYREALAITIVVDYPNVQEIAIMNNAPLLFIGDQVYGIFKEEFGPERNQKTLTIHVPDWRKIDNGAPISYTFRHDAPHKDNPHRIEFDPKLIKKRE